MDCHGRAYSWARPLVLRLLEDAVKQGSGAEAVRRWMLDTPHHLRSAQGWEVVRDLPLVASMLRGTLRVLIGAWMRHRLAALLTVSHAW